jgi:cytochrome c peroxidase
VGIKKKYGILALLLVLICAGAGIVEDERPLFEVPPKWPKPIYDFSKNALTQAGFKLGRKLFFDPLLSKDSSVSCSSCHLQFTGFTHVDHALSHGINGLKGTRNSMALINLAWNNSFMWDGGVNNLEVQPLNPITSQTEMDETLEHVVFKLNRSAAYRKRFLLAFGDSLITGQRVLKALAQFAVALESYNSKYDKHIRHEPGSAFTPEEERGLRLFRAHCDGCHKEPLFMSNTFENNGLPADKELKDIGRMKITGNPDDSLKFRVPTLRNISVSYPYMHDGRFHSLGQVLDHYTSGIMQSRTLAKQLRHGLSLTDDDKKDLILFLQTLTDKDFLFDLRFRDYVIEK